MWGYAAGSTRSKRSRMPLDGPAPPFRAMAATTLLTLVPLGLAFLAAFRLPHRARAAGAH